MTNPRPLEIISNHFSPDRKQERAKQTKEKENKDSDVYNKAILLVISVSYLRTDAEIDFFPALYHQKKKSQGKAPKIFKMMKLHFSTTYRLSWRVCTVVLLLKTKCNCSQVLCLLCSCD